MSERLGRSSATSDWRTAALAALIFLVALNLRPALTSLGPLLPQLGPDLGINAGIQGLLGSLPLLAFAVISPLVHFLSRRVGLERAILFALLLLTAGLVVRSYAGLGGLWVGTVVIGTAIAIGNVLVPALTRRDYRAQISRATGIYAACISIGAAVAAAVAVPLSNLVGWRGALGVWALPALIVAILWLPRTRTAEPSETPATTGPLSISMSVWRQPTAWLVTAFMGIQSTTFYVLVTWLPTIEVASGTSDTRAGLQLFLYQFTGFLGSLAVPRLMRRADSQVTAAVSSTALVLLGVLGVLWAPQWSSWWVILAGLGGGGALVVSLAMISLRGRTQQETTELSGMAQSMGYLLAAVGPVMAGVLTEVTGAWHAALVGLVVLLTLQIGVAVAVGKDRRPHIAEDRI